MICNLLVVLQYEIDSLFFYLIPSNAPSQVIIPSDDQQLLNWFSMRLRLLHTLMSQIESISNHVNHNIDPLQFMYSTRTLHE